MLMNLLLTFVFLGFNATAQASDPYKTFELGWKLYQDGLYDTATKIVDDGLSKNLDSHLKANFLYLKGHLLIKTGDAHGEAIEAFEDAQKIYKKLDSTRFLRDSLNCDQGLARVYIDQGKFEKASQRLRRLIDSQILEGQLGYVYYLSAKISYLQADYQTALSESQKSFQQYQAQGSKRGMADARLYIARNLILVGRAQEGIQENFKAQEAIVEIGDPNKFYYSLINQLLFQRCVNGLDAPHVVGMVEAYLDKQPDADLEKMLELAQEHCP